MNPNRHTVMMSREKYIEELHLLYEISKSSGDAATGLKILMLLLEYGKPSDYPETHMDTKDR